MSIPSERSAPVATFAVAGIVGVEDNGLRVVRFELACPTGCTHVLAVVKEHVLVDDPSRGPHGNGQVYDELLEALTGFLTRRMAKAGIPLLHRETLPPASGQPS